MIRELTIAAAIAGAAVALAPSAAADPDPMYSDNPGHYDTSTDVPGMNYDASLGAPCDNYQLFTFGRGPGGDRGLPLDPQPVAARLHRFWVSSYPLTGVQDIGAPCTGPKWRGAGARRSADGVPRRRRAGSRAR